MEILMNQVNIQFAVLQIRSEIIFWGLIILANIMLFGSQSEWKWLDIMRLIGGISLTIAAFATLVLKQIYL